MRPALMSIALLVALSPFPALAQGVHKQGPQRPVNINTATRTELIQIPTSAKKWPTA